eukprot:200860-Prorocentrum_minimum.AAC.1
MESARMAQVHAKAQWVEEVQQVLCAAGAGRAAEGRRQRGQRGATSGPSCKNGGTRPGRSPPARAGHERTVELSIKPLFSHLVTREFNFPVHEALRMLEDGRLSVLDQALDEKEEAIRRVEQNLDSTRAAAERAVASGMEQMNAKLAWCVEQLQTFVEGKRAPRLHGVGS